MGPKMNKLLTNYQLSTAILDLIEQTREYCFIVTPYYKPWHHLSSILEKAAAEQKRLVFCFRNQEPRPKEAEKLHLDHGFDVHYIPNLHAKIYLNERSVILSSMNLYDQSKENNHEIGYLHDSASVVKEIIKNSIEPMLADKGTVSFPGRYSEYLFAKEYESEQRKMSKGKKGYCLRCGKQIPFGLQSPYCAEDYSVWKNYSNPEYEEHHCHLCGKEAPTTMSRPLCPQCYSKHGLVPSLP